MNTEVLFIKDWVDLKNQEEIKDWLINSDQIFVPVRERAPRLYNNTYFLTKILGYTEEEASKLLSKK
jgi:hypothetical protein